MNKSDLKNFAIGARLALLQRVSDRAALYGVTEETAQARAIAPSAAVHKTDGSVMAAAEIAQRSALIARVYQIGFRPAMEEAAYTWFNRLIALKYMQEHSRLPIPVRPLPDAPGAQPRLLLEAQDVALPGVERERVLALLEGNQTDALYKYLLIALCNALAEPLPGMFEKISDATELLFPDGLLRADSVLAEMARLDADSWQEIQVIGWLYQYYNTQLKDETFELLKKNVKITKDRIGPATQLFTPEWIVRYMVENSLGRLWLEGHPNAELRAQWRYFMDEAPQEPAVAQQLAALRQSASALRPEQLTVLDPCMGSGHILVYAFDVLMQIYRSVGYTDRDAVQSILENNLFGLDIDDRAAQLAYFAVMMKACEYDRRFLRRGVQPHVCAIAESQPLDAAALAAFGPERELAQRLLDAFRDAKEYGSLLRPDFTEAELRRLDDRLTAMTAAQDSLFAIADSQTAAAALRPLLAQAHMLIGQYDAVITNPPYMGGSGMNAKLSDYVKAVYPDSKSDLFACFIERGNDIVKHKGLNCMVTMQSWMFLSSFEKMRCNILQTKDILCLMHMENMVLGIAFGTAVTVFRNSHVDGYKGIYNQIKLCDIENEAPRVFPIPGNRFSQVSARNFSKIPGAPVAYWVSERMLEVFQNQALSTLSSPRQGLATGENDRFTRMWYEVETTRLCLCAHSSKAAMQSHARWFPYNKGGDFRKWYGNNDCVVNWENDGNEIRNFKDERGKLRSVIRNPATYFQECISWSKISSGIMAFRYKPYGHVYDVAGTSIFAEHDLLMYLQGFCNSCIAMTVAKILSPTINYEVGHIANFPIKTDEAREKQVEDIVEDSITISKNDWDSNETSWDFKKHPMI